MNKINKYKLLKLKKNICIILIFFRLKIYFLYMIENLFVNVYNESYLNII